MSTTYQDEEERVECAVEEARASRTTPNFSELARKWDVNRLRISRRFKGGNSRSTRNPTNRKLTNEQEQVLVGWIQVLDELEISARPALIEASANQLLRDAHLDASTPPPSIGTTWVNNFVSRHSEISRVKQKSRELSRMTLDRGALVRWYDKLREAVQRFNILPDDLWNFDEVGFRIGIGGKQWILTLSPKKDKHIASETCRDTVTCIEGVNAMGEHIAPMIIIAAAQHSEAWYNNDLDDKTLIAVSENGYSDDMLGLRWVKHFEERTKKMTKGRYRLLIFDGHGSHCTQQFVEFCNQHDIVPFTLPPHASHHLQPLDVSVFQPYKHWHREAIDRATRTGCTHFDKVEFLAALNSIRAQTMKRNTIKAGFRLTGIHPFDPQQVLVKYPVPDPPRPVTPPPTGVEPASTPRTIRTLQRTAKDLLTRDGTEVSPTIARFVKGALFQASVGSLAQTALQDQTAAQQERNKRNERQRKVVQSGGILYAGEARVIVEEKLEAEKKANDHREWLRTKKEFKKRLGCGWAHLHGELKRAVKRRQRRLADAQTKREKEELKKQLEQEQLSSDSDLTDLDISEE